MMDKNGAIKAPGSHGGSPLDGDHSSSDVEDEDSAPSDGGSGPVSRAWAARMLASEHAAAGVSRRSALDKEAELPW